MGQASRSWTDSVTNAALFARLDMVEYLQWLGRRTHAVNGALPQFLHEFTHHWCFDSVVGSAAAMMRMRAQRYALLSPDAHEDQILSDLVCAETAEMVLQPLSEGLALFAEFDITPAGGRVYSRTTMASMICFGFALAEGGGRHSAMDLTLAGLLQTTRRRREFLERKAGIYAMPYEYEQGYLSGYLSVKALWAALAPRSKSLADRDTFLAFIRSWIYDDAGLARAIVTGHADHVRAGERIVQRVYDRFAQLIAAPDLAALVDRWEQAVEARQPVAAALGLTADEEREAAEAILLLNQDCRDEGPISDFAAHAFSTLQERKYVTLGSLPATATSGAAGVEIEVAGVQASYPAVAGMPHGRSAGEIHIVMPSRMNCLLTYWVTDAGTHLLKASGSTTGLDGQELERYLLNRQANDSVHADLREALDKASGEGMAPIILGHLRRQVLKSCDQVYGRLATLHAKEDAIDSVLALLRRKGLLSVVDGDHTLLRGLAAIGLANTSGSDSASMTLYEKLLGLDDDLIEHTIRSAEERHGMRLLQPGRSYGGAIALV